MHMYLPAVDARNGILVVSGDEKIILILNEFRPLFLFCVAPEAILEAAGGTLTDVIGNHYNYGANESFPNRMGVFATAKHIDHQQLIAILPDEIKRSLSEA